MPSSDAPTWMYTLSRMAFDNNVPLSKEFFSKREVINLVQLYPGVTTVLQAIDSFKREENFKKNRVQIHQFIITAGLKEYVEELMPKNMFSYIWGGRYSCVYPPGHEDDVESIPVFCMDETMKTRALYEISKGVFNSTVTAVNRRVEKESLWCPFLFCSIKTRCNQILQKYEAEDFSN